MPDLTTGSEATLFLVATPIGNLSEVSPRTLEVLKGVDVIACEDTRNTIRLLSHFDIHTRMIAYHNFNEKEASKGILKMLSEGKNVALVSDAGYPLISDPGYELTNAVIKEGYGLTCISGPSAGINALVASGLNASHYLFYGFLNARPSAAKKELEELREFPYTLIFYEAPHRINKTLKLALEVLGDRKAVVARELTKIHEEYLRGNLSELSKIEAIKGEIVLLIEGYTKEEKEVDFEALKKEVDDLLKEGYRTKEAVGLIAGKYGISKRELYDFYHH